MNDFAENSCKDDVRERRVAYFWKSASNSSEILELAIKTGIKSVALGSQHSLFLDYNGNVFARGCNKFGQLGLGNFDDRSEFTEVEYLTKKCVVHIECGSRHSAALTALGKVYCWGDSASGQCGVGDMKTVAEPALVYFIDVSGKDTSSVIVKLACGEMHSLGLTNEGKVWAWGSGCPLGLGNDMVKALTPQFIEDFFGKRVISIACGSYHSLAIVDVEDSANKKTNKITKTLGFDGQDGAQSQRRFSSRVRILRHSTNSKSASVEKSFSVPLVRKSNISLQSLDDSDGTTSDSGNESDLTHNSVKLETTSKPKSVDAGVTEEDGPFKPRNLERQCVVDSQSHDSISVQVWAWGRGTCGQLGHGTTEDRAFPCIVEELRGVHVVKIVAGAHHSLALTSYCQVYAWGDNSHAQLGIKKNIINKPRKVKSLSKILVWDIAAGSHYSLFLGDNFQNETNVYVCGKKPSGLPMSCMSSLMDFRDNLTTTMESDSLFHKSLRKESIMFTSKSETDITTLTAVVDGVKIGQMTYFQKTGVLRQILAKGEQCICLSVKEPKQSMIAVAEMASSERAFYYRLALVWQAILEPLVVTVLPTVEENEHSGLTLAQVCNTFHLVMRLVAVTSKRLTDIVRNVYGIGEAVGVLKDEKYFRAFEKYSRVYSDSVACCVFDCLGKDASALLVKSRFVFEELLDGFSKMPAQPDSKAFQEVLQLPLRRFSLYAEKISVLQALLPADSAEYLTLFELAMQWKALLSSDKERSSKAKLTREFWQECPAKLAETYKRSHRRLLKSSKTSELFPTKTGRFSSHWFVLLSDMFIHIVSNKNFFTYDLCTLWASPVADAHTENYTNVIRITTPEESFTVCTKTSAEKAQWLVTINQAVAKVLSKKTPYRLSSETVNTKCGSFTPAKARQATYFYLQDPKYKGACYSGMWLSGKPHGCGKMVWTSTAQTYEGEFRNGLFNGFGRMTFMSSLSTGVAEEYKGEWRDGMMHGHGEMSYSDKRLYIGHWMQNVRHGHGVLRVGTLSSSTPCIFTGNWDNDKRSGFGVMDDIMRGEKYMGMWENDVRCGNGLIVTLDGIYNEGKFSMNKLMGQGILLCDDNTKFEGEFCGDAQISGKGVLTIPNGDRIEGIFQGTWSEGLKVNGVYHKGTGPEEDSCIVFSEKSHPPTSQYYVPASKKWRSVFNECRHRLGCRGDDEPDMKKAWKCVSENLVGPPEGKSLRQERDLIDDVLRGVDIDQARKISKDKKKLQEYLMKAFDVPSHPLGRLLETLVDVYRATYVGMGAHSRLLPHAVEEIKSYIDRVYAILRILFPSLPNEDFVHITELGDVNDDSEWEGFDSYSLLAPLVFPRFYPPLFTLYALHNEKDNSAYWDRVLQLNKRSDLALMSYLEVKRTFWLAPEGDSSLVNEKDLTNWKHTHYYEQAVEAFQQISTKFSPTEKISVLRETFQRIHKEVRNFWQGKAKLMSLDDLFPVFQFVVIRSRVHHLGSEIHFIEDLMEAKHRAGEQGHMFTTLKACYYQILNEK